MPRTADTATTLDDLFRRISPAKPLRDRKRSTHWPCRSACRGYVDTGFACGPGRNPQTLVVTAPPSGTISVRAYCVRQTHIEAAAAQVAPQATIVALPDTDLGQRLAGTAVNGEALRSGLQARGVNPPLSEALELRQPPRAA